MGYDCLSDDQAGVTRLIDGEECCCVGLDVLEHGISDVYHCWQLIHNEVDAEVGLLYFDVFIGAPSCTEEIGYRVENLHPCGISVHHNEEY